MNSGDNKIIQEVKTKKSIFWDNLKKEKTLSLFRLATTQVPAYQNFLKSHKIKIESIKKASDLASLPTTDKKNYLRKYSLCEVTTNGHLGKPLIFTSTSGSTGDPFYFHRSFELDWQASIIHELFYLQGNYKKDEPVLVVVCFGMGIWIGGLITYQAFHLVQERGYNISLVTPGINKEEIFKSLKNLRASYKNIILVGYPPFIKDILNEGPANGIDWHKFRVRLLFAAETFTESFREHVATLIHSKNPLLDTMNIYGTADLGAMAFETPLAILIRRLCANHKTLSELIFNNIKKTPTLCQYIPSFTAFDTDGENLLASGYNSIPLVRYSLGDHGGIYSFDEVVSKFSQTGLDLKREAKMAGIEDFWYELPFVYVYERDDFSIKLYGATIYPEHIREALQSVRLTPYLTGKFTLITKYDRKNNQYMEVNCELKNGHKSSKALNKKVKQLVIKKLLEKNAEYSNNFKSIPKKVEPHIVLWSHEHILYFKPGTKQKWVGLDAILDKNSKKLIKARHG